MTTDPDEKPVKPKKKRKKPRSPEAVFMRRSGEMYHNQKKRARAQGIWLDYDTEELRDLIRRALSRKSCQYCGQPLTPENFSVDHANPVCRGGSWQLGNLLVCCMTCNQVKGALDQFEFRQLIHATQSWPNFVRVNLFARIKAGSRFAQLNIPKTPRPAQERDSKDRASNPRAA